MRRLMAVATLLLAGCADHANEDAQAFIAGQLKDPASAQFQKVQSLEHDGTLLSCGQVNAKNAMGGYVGFTDYMLWQGRTRFANDNDRPLALRQCCLSVYGALKAGTPPASDDKVRGWCSRITHPFRL